MWVHLFHWYHRYLEHLEQQAKEREFNECVRAQLAASDHEMTLAEAMAAGFSEELFHLVDTDGNTKAIIFISMSPYE